MERDLPYLAVGGLQIVRTLEHNCSLLLILRLNRPTDRKVEDLTTCDNIKIHKGVAMDKLLTIQEVAKYMRVHPMTIKRWIKAGNLKATRFGHTLRVSEKEVEDFLHANTDSS